MHTKIDELMKDFKELSDKLDIKGYNPMANDFQKALSVGVMAFIMHELNKEYREEVEDEFDGAMDELRSAEAYYDMYLNDKNPVLKTMASQELSHANFWLNKIKAMHKTAEEQSKYNSLLNWHNSILDKLNR